MNPARDEHDGFAAAYQLFGLAVGRRAERARVCEPALNVFVVVAARVRPLGGVRVRDERGQKEREGEYASRHLGRPRLFQFERQKLRYGLVEEFSTTPRAGNEGVGAYRTKERQSLTTSSASLD